VVLLRLSFTFASDGTTVVGVLWMTVVDEGVATGSVVVVVDSVVVVDEGVVAGYGAGVTVVWRVVVVLVWAFAE
jgi:hypothetical protein